MISCTEFIFAYSELFKFLEKKGGEAEVKKYWEHISDTYVSDRLGECVEKEGLRGCFTYWSRSLSEEAADFRIEYDPDKKEFTLDMFICPSRKMLNEHPEMKPYHNYCGHCYTLYARVVERYGMSYDIDFSKVDEAKCRIVIKDKVKN